MSRFTGGPEGYRLCCGTSTCSKTTVPVWWNLTSSESQKSEAKVNKEIKGNSLAGLDSSYIQCLHCFHMTGGQETIIIHQHHLPVTTNAQTCVVRYFAGLGVSFHFLWCWSHPSHSTLPKHYILPLTQ